MAENMENKKPRHRINDRMLVIVNNDWTRNYSASIHSINRPDGKKEYSAKCKLKDCIALCKATDKNELSRRMDQLATVIEEYTSRKLPYGIPLVMDIICGLN